METHSDEAICQCKHRYQTRTDAYEVILRVNREVRHGDRKKRKKNFVYRCGVCKGFHLSMLADMKRKRRSLARFKGEMN